MGLDELIAQRAVSGGSVLDEEVTQGRVVTQLVAHGCATSDERCFITENATCVASAEVWK